MANRSYSQAAERLLERLEAHRGEYDSDCLEGDFPWDSFCERNPSARGLLKEVQDELDYELSEKQCSWAVVRFCAE